MSSNNKPTIWEEIIRVIALRIGEALNTQKQKTTQRTNKPTTTQPTRPSNKQNGIAPGSVESDKPLEDRKPYGWFPNDRNPFSSSSFNGKPPGVR